MSDQAPDEWSAPAADGGIDASIVLPGSKSITNRWFIIAALSDQPTTLIRPLRARDSELMAAALRSLGTEVDWRQDSVVVTPTDAWGSANINCGLAGNVMRFVPAISGLAHGTVHFDGDPRARERPLAPLLAALRVAGVEINDDGRGSLPMTVKGRGHIPGGEVEIDSSSSSQFVSALLLAACRFDNGLQLRHTGDVLPSRPHIEMTVRLLKAAGVDVTSVGDMDWTVKPAVPSAVDAVVEPDLSNAFAFFCAALITQGSCDISGFPAESVQPTDRVQEIVAAFGGSMEQDNGTLCVKSSQVLRGVDLDLSDVGELVPNVAAVAALAPSPSRIRGVAHLRGHETDRLAALVSELSSLGCDIKETSDGLVVNPRTLTGGTFRTYDDHRMATTGALLGLVTPNLRVENIGTTSKTIPNFPRLWEEMLGR